MKKQLHVLALSVITMVVVASAILPGMSSAYNNNNVMDDSVFNNANSMSAGQINAWLNANFPSSCISPNNGFSSPDPTGYSPSTGYTYGGNVTAGQVIADAGLAYGLNPQVLLATLQKESSVVSGDASYHCTYINTAMGYGCPDSGSCPTNPATMSGFSKQIIHAAWLLKFGQQRALGNTSWNVQFNNYPQPGHHWDNSDDPPTTYSGPMTQGVRARVNGGSMASYDGLSTIDGTTVHMDTGATAAFYWYTPHFHGNQNFDNIFTAWFGSIYGGDIGQYAYRMYNPGTSRHNFTARENQRDGIKGLGYRDDGLAFKVSPTQESGMVPIYRLYNGRLHDYWMIPDGPNRYWALIHGGYGDEGVAWYAYPANPGSSGSICPAGQAVFQLWSPGHTDHYYTTDAGARYWQIIFGGYVDDRSGTYVNNNQGSSSYCIPY